MFQSLAGVGIIHQNELVPLLFLDSLQVLIGSARVTGDKTGSAALLISLPNYASVG